MKKIIFIGLIFLGTLQVVAQDIEILADTCAAYLAEKLGDKIRSNEKVFSDVFSPKSQKIKICFQKIRNLKNEETLLGNKISSLIAPKLQQYLNSLTYYNFWYEISFGDTSACDFILISSGYYLSDSIFLLQNVQIKNGELSLSYGSFFLSDKDIKLLKNWDIKPENLIYEKFIKMQSSAGLIDSVKFYDYQTKNELKFFELDTSSKYIIRIWKKTNTFLYVFFYSPEKSELSLIYPYTSGGNRMIAQSLKVVFFRTDAFRTSGIFKIIVSRQRIPLLGFDKQTRNFSAQGVGQIIDILEKGRVEWHSYNFVAISHR